MKKLQLPLSDADIAELKCGDSVLLSGKIYTARDAAHAIIANHLKENVPLPFSLKGMVIYYCGPTPTLEGEIIGSCGPTTSARMDDFTPLLIEQGAKIMIGKGKRSVQVNDAIKKHKGLYLCAVGGAGALIKSCVLSCKVVAFPQLGCEAVHELQVKDFPLIVGTDSDGNSFLR